MFFTTIFKEPAGLFRPDWLREERRKNRREARACTKHSTAQHSTALSRVQQYSGLVSTLIHFLWKIQQSFLSSSESPALSSWLLHAQSKLYNGAFFCRGDSHSVPCSTTSRGPRERQKGNKYSGMRWDEKEWSEMAWKGMQWNETTWNVMEWNQIKWSGVKRNEMRWNDLNWNENGKKCERKKGMTRKKTDRGEISTGVG